MQLQEIDELIRRDHFFIEAEDICYFLREYTARAGFGYGETNQIISNLKKKMDRRGKPDWHYKGDAIRQAARELRDAIGDEALTLCTVVPMPPSKIATNPMYDDRLCQLVRAMTTGVKCDVRELLRQRYDMDAAHESAVRPRPDDLYNAYCVDESCARPEPKNILLVDDVLTAGAHFAGAKRRLRERFPSARLFGVFYARRIFEKASDES